MALEPVSHRIREELILPQNPMESNKGGADNADADNQEPGGRVTQGEANP